MVIVLLSPPVDCTACRCPGSCHSPSLPTPCIRLWVCAVVRVVAPLRIARTAAVEQCRERPWVLQLRV
jgi:hypothetical protein